MKTHFDKEVDEIRKMLFDKIKDMKENPNLFEENKQEYVDVLTEQMNKMEFARVVHNHYVVTGKVQIPD
jgi:uncharacterized protein (UPF0305 family)